ncbi:LysR family transcriptional regulator [Roseibium album]|uniref:LysR family transcriptional regulator n=1 Tax=Roseibium album TaxID=311410 RepID=UPI00248F989D|nr:LysR family transcriptional regulator [Roseibium album]
MKLIQLQYFCSIVDQGGFIAASRDLNVAQPALSRQVSDLENELCCQLLVRGPSGTSVTDAGQKFYNHAREILEKIDTARSDMQLKSELLTGDVIIALPVGLAAQLAALIVQQVARQYPGISVKLEDGLGYQAGQSLEAGKADFGILANVGNLQNVTFDPVLEENLFFFKKREEHEPVTTDIDLIDLQAVPLVMPNRKVHVRRNLENMMIKIGGRLNICYEQQSLLTIRSMVKAGIGATVMNWPSMSDLWFSGDVDARRICKPGLSRTVCLAVPNFRQLSNSAQVTYEIVRKILASEVANGNWKSGKILENRTINAAGF